MFTITIRNLTTSLWRARGVYFAVGVLLAGVSLLIGATGSLKGRPAKAESVQTSAADTSAPPVPQGLGPQYRAPITGPVQVIRLTIHPQGLYPRGKVHASLPHLAISVEDLSGGSSGLLIQPNPPSLPILVFNNVAFVPVPTPALLQPATSTGSFSTGGRLRWRADLWLTPGSYLISDASRPGNQTVLVVDPPLISFPCELCPCIKCP